jgi:predicted dehydrogenase
MEVFMNKLSAAILGAGNMGKCHGSNLLKLDVDITAICDLNSNACASFKEHLKLPNLAEYTDFNKMLDEVPFDMLFICLPPFAQKGQFQIAAKAGKHIFIEKPIAINTVEGKSMLNAAIESNVITQVGFDMRWGSAVKKLKELIKSGKAGRPVSFAGRYECNSLHTPWWINVNLCGGQIFEQAIHVYDMCRHFIGHPKFASGIMSNICHNHIHEYTVEDVSASIAGFTNGAVSTITATNCAVPGIWVSPFTVVFEKVTVFFDNPNKAKFAFIEDNNVRYELVDESVDTKFEEVSDFVTAIKEGKKSKCSIEEGYLSLCYVETVVSSATLDGIKVSVPAL